MNKYIWFATTKRGSKLEDHNIKVYKELFRKEKKLNVFVWPWQKWIFVGGMLFFGELIAFSHGFVITVLVGYVFLFSAIILWDEWQRRK